jgi:PEP-CTERM motif
MRLRKLIQCLLAGVSLQVSAAHALVYLIDDGSLENSAVAFTMPLTFANHFIAVAGGQTIESISIAWASRPPNTAAGTPLIAKLWSDPNGDGNPDDAVLLSAIAGITADLNAVGLAVFTTYDIPDVTLLIGQSFFVGGSVPSNTAVGVDRTPPISNESWFAPSADFLGSSPINLGEVANAELMVRANGTAPAAVPEPTSLALLATALFGFGVARHARIARAAP